MAHHAGHTGRTQGGQEAADRSEVALQRWPALGFPQEMQGKTG